MKKLLMLICVIAISCEKVELLPTTSLDINQKIKSYKGNKVVLLNVWSLWCVPCVEEFPMIVDLAQEIEELEVIFISADFEDQFNEVRSFLDRNGVKEVSYIKQEKDEAFITGIHPNWTGSLPFTILYAKESGKIVDLWEGKESELRFRTAINIALRS
tara:strand:+ start:98 stop:571 length:474 start_codon:yes stop_codon:yes gene_type:complete